MKFHDELNPKLWNKDENKGETSYSLKSEVADKLMEIASFFIESNSIPEDAIEDIRLLGSSANFNYNKYSDIDLHLVVDFDKLHEDCPIVNDYAWAIKQIFNQEHEISIYDIPVEIYIEPVDQPANSNGVYSLIDQDWLKKPEKIEPTDNDTAVQAKFEEISQAIDKIEDSEYADELLDKIYAMRKSGLAEGGEFSTENMAFKLLRNGGYLDKLREMKKANIDKELTLEKYIGEKQTMRKTISEERVEPSEIYDLAVANLPAEDIDHHASDLYIRKTPESEALIKQMGDQAMLSTFVDNIDGDVWYDLPFCYKPYWTKSESLENKEISEGNFEQQSTAWYDFCAYVKQIMSEGHDFDEAVYEAIDDTVYGADVINIWTNLPGNLGSRENEIVDLMREDIQEACYEEQEYIEGLDESLEVNEISNELKDRVTDARKKELKNADRAFVATRNKAWKDTEGMEPRARKEAIINNDKLNKAEDRANKAARKLINNRMLRKAQSESLADSMLKEAHEVLSMNESADATTWSFKANGFSKAMTEKQNVFGNSEVRCVITENANGKLEGTATVNYFMTKEQVEETIKNALRENGFRTTVISELVNLY